MLRIATAAPTFTTRSSVAHAVPLSRLTVGAELPAAVDAIVKQLASAPTRGLAATKQAIYAAAGNTLEAQLDLERDLQRELGRSADYREGVAAFAAKRPPQFVGK